MFLEWIRKAARESVIVLISKPCQEYENCCGSQLNKEREDVGRAHSSSSIVD